MDTGGTKIQLIGVPCGEHGPYTFYKTLRYVDSEKFHHFSLGEFFFMRISENGPVCLGELQLLWSDKNFDYELASIKVYFLPDNTPEGRQEFQGKDEVLVVSEKIILRLDDLRKWMVTNYNWTVGAEAVYSPEENGHTTEPSDSRVVVVSYPQYCRLRSMLLRVEGLEDKWLRNALVQAIGGFTVKTPSTRILFCRDVIDCEELDDHEFRCDHLAPKLKGRPRKKKSRKDSYTDADSSSGSSDIPKAWLNKIKTEGPPTTTRQKGIRFRDKMKDQDDASTKEREFFQSLHKFMKERNTPIGRIPCLGFKQKIDLYFFYTYAQKLGGYQKITERRLWKHLYDKLGGNPSNTGAATCTRRHYERLLLPYERYQGAPRSQSVEETAKTHHHHEAPSMNGQLSAEKMKKQILATHEQTVAEKERLWNERRRRELLDRGAQLKKSPEGNSIGQKQQTAKDIYSPLDGLAALSKHPGAVPTNPFPAVHPMMQHRPFMYAQMSQLQKRRRPQVYGPPDLDIEHLRSSKRPKMSTTTTLSNGHASSGYHCDEQPQDLSLKSNKNRMGEKSWPSETIQDLRKASANHSPTWPPSYNNSNSRSHMATNKEVISSKDTGKDRELSKAEQEIRDQARLIADMTSSAASASAQFQPHVHPAFMIQPPGMPSGMPPGMPPGLSPGMVPPVHLQQLYQAQLQANAAHVEAWKKLMGGDNPAMQMQSSPYFIPQVPMLPQMHHQH